MSDLTFKEAIKIVREADDIFKGGKHETHS